MSNLNPTFAGLKNEDPEEYTETIELQGSSEPSQTRETHYRVTFRTGLQGKAKAWYGKLATDIRQDWTKLKEAFYAKYNSTSTANFEETFHRQQQVYSLARDIDTNESVVGYCKRAKRLREKCSLDLQKEIPQRILGGLRDTDLQFRVQSHLLVHGKLMPEGGLKPEVTFDDIRSATVASTTLIGQKNEFESDQDDSDENASWRNI